MKKLAEFLVKLTVVLIIILVFVLWAGAEKVITFILN